MAVLIDLTGQKFGRLTVLSRDPQSPLKAIRWLCRCDCGKESSVFGANLRRNHTVSCGCVRAENSYLNTRKHGHATNKGFTGAYKSWAKMRERVKNPNSIRYAHYGGRGITIDPEWDDFNVFYRDMGPRPPGTSIERIDRNGNYEKSNCIWASDRQQANNKRNNMTIEWQGETKTVAQWAEEIGLPRDILYKRIHTHKWPVDKAMTQPARPTR